MPVRSKHRIEDERGHHRAVLPAAEADEPGTFICKIEFAQCLLDLIERRRDFCLYEQCRACF